MLPAACRETSEGCWRAARAGCGPRSGGPAPQECGVGARGGRGGACVRIGVGVELRWGGGSAILPLPQTSSSLPPEHKDGVGFFFIPPPRPSRCQAWPRRRQPLRLAASPWGAGSGHPPGYAPPAPRSHRCGGPRCPEHPLRGWFWGGTRLAARSPRPAPTQPRATKKMLLEVHGAGKAGAWVRQQPELA